MHTVRGFEHKLRVTDGQELAPERGLVGVYLDGKIIVVPVLWEGGTRAVRVGGGWGGGRG